MIDLTQYLSSITLKTAEKRLFWAFLKPIWVLKGIKIIFFTIISLYNDFWGQTKPLTTPNRDRLDTPHIIPYVQCLCCTVFPQDIDRMHQHCGNILRLRLGYWWIVLFIEMLPASICYPSLIGLYSK